MAGSTTKCKVSFIHSRWQQVTGTVTKAQTLSVKLGMLSSMHTCITATQTGAQYTSILRLVPLAT